MSIEENKVIATRFCEFLAANNAEAAIELLSDDATYWILGRRDVIPTAGAQTKAGMRRIFTAMAERMPNWMTFKASNMIAEGDQVAFEAEGHGELANGRVYNNLYHIRMTIRAGKIVAAREYLDTQHVFATWFAP